MLWLEYRNKRFTSLLSVMFASWCKDEDKDIRWVVKQNLAKKRLQRLDQDWVDDMRRFLSN